MKYACSSMKRVGCFGSLVLSVLACSIASASTETNVHIDPQETAVMASASTITYVYTDPQGTTLAEADPNGNVIAQFDYRPYGSAYSGAGMASPENGPGYTGHVNDPDTALIYMQARYYDPAVGRFLSVDPKTPTAGNEFDFNRFAYVNDNPIRNIDPDGTTCTQSVKGRYTCSIDGNKAGLSAKQVQAVNKAYTNAVNRLNSHPDAKVTIALGGKSFQASAGEVARGLANARVDTGPASSSARADTLGAGLFATSNYHLDYTPVIRIFENSVTSDRSGGTANIATDLERTFVHEGLHTQPRERALFDVYNADKAHWDTNHREAYNAAGNVLYDGRK